MERGFETLLSKSVFFKSVEVERSKGLIGSAVLRVIRGE
jgi:hypothetical protein